MAHRSLLSGNESLHASFPLRRSARRQAEAHPGGMEYHRAMACRRVVLRQLVWSAHAICLRRLALSAFRAIPAVLCQIVGGTGAWLQGPVSKQDPVQSFGRRAGLRAVGRLLL